MKKTFLATFYLVISGCQTYTECEWQYQADLVEITWENEFGDPLTEKQSICLHSFFVVHRSNKWFDTFGFYNGYTRQRINGPATIAIREGLDPVLEAYTLRHELTHRLGACVFNNEYSSHNHEMFAFSGYAKQPGSLSVLATQYEEQVGFVCE